MRHGIKISLWSRLDSPMVPLVVVAITYLLFINARLAMHGNDPSFFVTAGDKYSNPDLVPKNLSVLHNSPGYDGQFYYRLALNPFTSKPTDFGLTLDFPAHRHQRIIYPLIVWTVSLSRPDFVPAVMILVNYLALCLMGWIGGSYAQLMRHHALWGLALPFYPGFLLTLSRDLIEILEICLLLASLLLSRRGRHLLASLILSLAILTRETALMVAMGTLCARLVRAWQEKDVKKLKGTSLLVPFMTYAVWQLLLLYRWGYLSVLEVGHLIGLPFSGFINFFLYTAALETYFQRLWFIELCFIIAFTIAVIYSLGSTSAWAHERISWLFYAMLISLWTRFIWIEDWGFLRALSEFYILGAIILIGSQSKIKTPTFACSMALWLFLFLREIR